MQTNLTKAVTDSINGLDTYYLTFVELHHLTNEPIGPLAAYEADGERDINGTVAAEWYAKGSGIGILPESGIYIVKFGQTNLSAVTEAIRFALLKDNSFEQPVPIFGSWRGDYLAIFRRPKSMLGMPFRHLVRNIRVPWAPMAIDLHLGHRICVRILGPGNSASGLLPVTQGWTELPVLDPRVWTDEGEMTNSMPPMLVSYAEDRGRNRKAIIHLRRVKAGLKPTDDPKLILQMVAADMVHRFQYDPHHGVDLLFQPLQKAGSGSSLMDAIKQLPGVPNYRRDQLLTIFEDAMDIPSPLAVAAFNKVDGDQKLNALIDLMVYLPPKASEEMIPADDLRILACNLLGVDPGLITQRAFGLLMTSAMESGKIPVKRARVESPTNGSFLTVYKGVNETTLREVLLWWKDQANS